MKIDGFGFAFRFTIEISNVQICMSKMEGRPAIGMSAGSVPIKENVAPKPKKYRSDLFDRVK